MKVLGLDGKEYNLKLKTQVRGKCSELHLRARKVIKNIFPVELVFEEVALPGSKTDKNSSLYLDFLLTGKKLAIEVQGKQHFEYNTFHYNNKVEFGKAQNRDSVKRDWCEMNNITLIELPYNESDDEWTSRIESR